MNMENISFTQACQKLMKWKGIENLPTFSYKDYAKRLDNKNAQYEKKVKMETLSNLYASLSTEDYQKISFLFCCQNLLSQQEFISLSLELLQVETQSFVKHLPHIISTSLKEDVKFIRFLMQSADKSFPVLRQFLPEEPMAGKLNFQPPLKWMELSNRYVFPVFLPGRIPIGMSGRGSDTDIVKYMTRFNFNLDKDDILYGLELALDVIKAQHYVIIVEGILDVLRCRAAGYYNTVAPLSTSLSEKHVILLKSLTDKFLLCYDSDTGGQAASEVAKRNLDKYRLLYEEVTLPEGEDPDSYGRKSINSLNILLTNPWQ